MPILHAVLYQPMVIVRQTKKASIRFRDLQKHGKCLVCEEPLKPDGENRRGCCPNCYQATRRAIAKGKVTDAELMRKGFLTEPGAGGRPPKNKLSKQIAEGRL